MTRHVYVGHDSRELEAYQVCRYSLHDHAEGIAVHPIKHLDARRAGLFWREWRVSAMGQYIDRQDDKPFSTEFAFTRFLVPELERRRADEAAEHPSDWVLFCDCDFLWRDDVNKLFDLAEDRYAVMVVKHEHQPTALTKKEGVEQTRYFRKNWSSLILWHVGHHANHQLGLKEINHQPGAWLHSFAWLEDSRIGALPEVWNWLVGQSPTIPLSYEEGEDRIVSSINPLYVNALHFTNGGPWLPQFSCVRYADEWRMALNASRNPRPIVRERMIAA